MIRFWLVVMFALVSVTAFAPSGFRLPCGSLRRAQEPDGIVRPQRWDQPRACAVAPPACGDPGAGEATPLHGAKCDGRVLQRLRRSCQKPHAGATPDRRRRDFGPGYVRACRPGSSRSAARPHAQDSGKTSVRRAGMIGGNSMLFCVRLSDGYFFPAPKSQFVQAAMSRIWSISAATSATMPASTCTRSSDPSLETEKMVALDTRKPYKDLPAAFKYRDDANFKACDVKRYYQRVAELRARTVTPANMSQRHHSPAVGKAGSWHRCANSPARRRRPGGQGAAQQQSVESLAGSRPVRVVGPAFFPAD